MNQFIDYLKNINFFDDFIVEFMLENNLTNYFTVKVKRNFFCRLKNY